MMIEVQNSNSGKQQSFLFSSYSFIILILSLSYFLIRFTYSIFINFESNWFNFYIILTDIHLLGKILLNGYFLIIFFLGIILWTVLIGILSFN